MFRDDDGTFNFFAITYSLWMSLNPLLDLMPRTWKLAFRKNVRIVPIFQQQKYRGAPSFSDDQ